MHAFLPLLSAYFVNANARILFFLRRVRILELICDIYDVVCFVSRVYKASILNSFNL